MKLWGREKRAAESGGSYTDRVVEEVLAQAAGATGATPAATGALEIAAGFVGRAFASARVTGDNAEAVTPGFLSMVGRQLIRAGELVAAMRVERGVLRFAVADQWDISGREREADWSYALQFGAPSGQGPVVNLPAGGVVHFRYAVEPSRPWAGLSPVSVAALAGRLSAETAGMLADEAAGPRGYLLPVPSAGGQDDTVAGLRRDIAGLRGRLATIEAQQSLAAAEGLNRRREWDVVRIGGAPPEVWAAIMDRATNEVLSACGIPQGLVIGDAVSAGLREAWRVFLFGTLAPLGNLVEAELSAKLETSISLQWDDLRASDIASRARAFQSLVGGGMAVEAAAAVSGVLSQED